MRHRAARVAASTSPASFFIGLESTRQGRQRDHGGAAMISLTPTEKVLAQLSKVKKYSDYWTASCPAHDDRHHSLSIREVSDGVASIKCHAGCPTDRIMGSVGLKTADLFPRSQALGAGSLIPTIKCSTAQQSAAPIAVTPATASTLVPRAAPSPNGFVPVNNYQGDNSPHGDSGADNGDGSTTADLITTGTSAMGCSVEQYAAAKALPVEFLRDLGLTDIHYSGQPAIRIPYYAADGTEAAVRVRTALYKGESGDNRFRWRKGSKLCPYGLWRLDAARQAGYIVLCEGESDAHTAWFHNVPALGLPGASTWKEEWAQHLDGIATIYVVIEPDNGGEAVLKSLSASLIRDRVRLLSLEVAQ